MPSHVHWEIFFALPVSQSSFIPTPTFFHPISIKMFVSFVVFFSTLNASHDLPLQVTVSIDTLCNCKTPPDPSIRVLQISYEQTSFHSQPLSSDSSCPLKQETHASPPITCYCDASYAIYNPKDYTDSDSWLLSSMHDININNQKNYSSSSTDDEDKLVKSNNKTLSCSLIPYANPPHDYLRHVNDTQLVKVLRRATTHREQTVVLFHAQSWCPFSKAIMPMATDLAFLFHKSVCILSVDGYQHAGVNSRYGVHGFPTWMIFDKGDPLSRFTANRTLQNLVSWVQNNTNVISPVQVNFTQQSFLCPTINQSQSSKATSVSSQFLINDEPPLQQKQTRDSSCSSISINSTFCKPSIPYVMPPEYPQSDPALYGACLVTLIAVLYYIVQFSKWLFSKKKSSRDDEKSQLSANSNSTIPEFQRGVTAANSESQISDSHNDIDPSSGSSASPPPILGSIGAGNTSPSTTLVDDPVHFDSIHDQEREDSQDQIQVDDAVF